MPNVRSSYTVIKDTREKKGWSFGQFGDCDGMEVSTLKTGDYSMKGFENKLCIERKACVEEIAGNLGKKIDAFESEMERMSEYENAFIICEFSMSDLINFPEGSNMSDFQKTKVRMSGKFLLKRLVELQLKYNIKIWFCDNEYNAFLVAHSLFKRLHESLNVNKEKN